MRLCSSVRTRPLFSCWILVLPPGSGSGLIVVAALRLVSPQSPDYLGLELPVAGAAAPQQTLQERMLLIQPVLRAVAAA